MIAVIVNASELGTKCWNPARFVGECAICSKVSACKFTEAEHGRLVLAMKAEKKLEALAQQAKIKRKSIEEKLNEKI